MADDVLIQLKRKSTKTLVTLAIYTGIVSALLVLVIIALLYSTERALLIPPVSVVAIVFLVLTVALITLGVKGSRRIRSAATILGRRQPIRIPVTFQLTTSPGGDVTRPVETWHALVARADRLCVPLIGRPQLPSGTPCRSDRLPRPVPDNMVEVTWDCDVYGELDKKSPLIIIGPEFIAISATDIQLPAEMEPMHETMKDIPHAGAMATLPVHWIDTPRLDWVVIRNDYYAPSEPPKPSSYDILLLLWDAARHGDGWFAAHRDDVMASLDLLRPASTDAFILHSLHVEHSDISQDAYELPDEALIGAARRRLVAPVDFTRPITRWRSVQVEFSFDPCEIWFYNVLLLEAVVDRYRLTLLNTLRVEECASTDEFEITVAELQNDDRCALLDVPQAPFREAYRRAIGAAGDAVPPGA